MSLYQHAMLQALGIAQYVPRDMAVADDVETQLQHSSPEPAHSQSAPQVNYPAVPDPLIRDIHIALGKEVMVRFSATLSVDSEQVSLPYPFTPSDKPTLFNALHSQA